jgi:hypothetical protein
MTRSNLKKIAFASTFAVFFSMGSALADSGALPPGVYEGSQLEMIVTTDGAVLNTGCRKGVISAPILLSDDGSFDSTGTMNPLLPMNPPIKAVVSLAGKYSPQDLSVSVIVQIGEGTEIPYNLVLNGPKNLDVACPR